MWISFKWEKNNNNNKIHSVKHQNRRNLSWWHLFHSDGFAQQKSEKLIQNKFSWNDDEHFYFSIKLNIVKGNILFVKVMEVQILPSKSIQMFKSTSQFKWNCAKKCIASTNGKKMKRFNFRFWLKRFPSDILTVS